jgi:hypothetical protein
MLMRKFLSKWGLGLVLAIVILMDGGGGVKAEVAEEATESATGLEGGAWKEGVCVVSKMDDKEIDVATIQGLACLAANVLSVILGLLAFAGFVMFVIAGAKLLISGGQPSHLESAKNTLTYAVFGLLLAVSSFVILNIIALITGAEILSFTFLPETVPASSTSSPTST